MSLPLLISVPHAGIQAPPEVEHLNLLMDDKIIEDSGEGAREIYDIQNEVAAFVTTEIARAFGDLNQAEDDRGPDGVVKSETIYKVAIYRMQLQVTQIHGFLSRYYRPYHQELSRLAQDVILGVDCHTMAAKTPPVCAASRVDRPMICLSNAGTTRSPEWFFRMADCLTDAFDGEVALNDSFRGGHIIRSLAVEVPWMQLEISRAEFMSLEEKKYCLQIILR